MTGWRLGYVAAPDEIIEGIMKVHQYVMMSAPTPAQYAALEALTGGEADVEEMVASYDRRRRLMVDGLNRIGLHCTEPRGAFYAFPDISAAGSTTSRSRSGCCSRSTSPLSLVRHSGSAAQGTSAAAMRLPRPTSARRSPAWSGF